MTTDPVLTLLDRGPLTVGEIAAALGASGAVAEEALVALRSRRLAFAEGSPPRWSSFAWWLSKNGGLLGETVGWIARRCPWCEFEELFNELVILAQRSVASYRPNRGTKFSTYAVGFHSKRLLWRWAGQQKHRGVHVASARVFEEGVAPIVGDLVTANLLTGLWDVADTPGRGSGLPDDFWERVERAVARHPNPRVGVCLLGVHRDGRKLKELGRELGLSHERVRQLANVGVAWLGRCGELDAFEDAA